MKNLISLIFLLTGFVSVSYTQSVQENLKKYWYYRERLKNFVLVSPNYNEEGTNIPAERITQQKDNPDSPLEGDEIHWDDGNYSFNQYISVLATEYRLLKEYNQDYTQTLYQLYYALKSFERIDANAESYYRSSHVKYPEDLNGFFVRDDITEAFWDKYGKNGETPYFKQERSTRVFNTDDPFADNGKNYECSEDNCWHLMEAFAITHALVDKEYVNGKLVDFKKLVEGNVERMVGNMVHDELIYTIDWGIDPPQKIEDELAYNWYMENPVTGNLVVQGDGTDGTMMYASYGFARAANRILGETKFTTKSYSAPMFMTLFSESLAELYLRLGVYNRVIPIVLTGYIDVELRFTGELLNLKLFDFVPDPPMYKTIYKWETDLWDISTDDYELRSLSATGNIPGIKGEFPYQLLIKKQYESKEYKYEHFPLIWSVINNMYVFIKPKHVEYILDLLNKAPYCGPYYKTPENNGGAWSSSSRLVWPEKINGGSSVGEYNGIDYMLLHNLFWLANVTKYPTSVECSNFEDFISNTIIAVNDIICSAAIESEEPVSLIAGNTIKLKPGFKFDGENSKFIGKIIDGLGNNGEPLFYKKQFLAGCPSCEGFIGLMDNSKQEKTAVQEPEGFIINVFPNPCTDYINFVSKSESFIKRVEIYNVNRQMIIRDFPPESIYVTLDVSQLNSGIYFVRVYDENNRVANSKIIKS